MTPSFGASLLSHNRARFRLWAPNLDAVTVEIEGAGEIQDASELPMARLTDGWFETEAPAHAGTRYRFRVSPDLLVPDPASHAQAGGVHDASIVVDHNAFDWRHTAWRGRPWHETVLYEIHPGAVGGFAGITEQLPELAALGITAIELMPIAAFPGARNWGYDGVLLYAPASEYGTPKDLKLLIDTAHGLNLMVMLDVVYNHFGPEGNYLGAYARDFYRDDITTPWGDALDVRSPIVRKFFIENAIHWLTDYRFDGLRLDAVHAINDESFLRDLARQARAATPGRHIHLVLENDEQNAALLNAETYDAQWSDDWHHCLHVLLTGEVENYYRDYADGTAARLAHCLAEGFDYQGQPSMHRKGHPRGTPSGHLPPTRFIHFLQNHDHIGNRAFGERLTAIASPDAVRAATVLLLLSPHIPMLFMGQEWAATAPFPFFTGFEGELASAVRDGRRREFAGFAAFADPARRDTIPDPNHPATFAASTPRRGERLDPTHAAWLALHRDLLAIRASQIVPRLPGTTTISAAALDTAAVIARWRMGDGAELTIAANVGRNPCPCPRLEGETLFALNGAGEATLPAQSAIATLKPAT